MIKALTMKNFTPKVAIILLNWNGWKDTIECLESLYQINYPNYDVIVIDNDSKDDSIEKLKKYCEGKIKVKSEFFQYDKSNKPIKLFEFNENELKIEKEISNLPSNKKIILIKNSSNHGFAGGNNVGIEYAINFLKSNYVLLLNNDTVVDPNFLIELINVAESDEKIGFVGAKTYFYDDKDIIQATGGGKIDFKEIITIEPGLNQIDDGKYDENFELDYITGSCILCKGKVIDKVGMLNKNYFMYWEDVDWCFRGKIFGYKSVYAFKSKIWHKVSVSSTNYLKVYYCTRNRIYFMEQNIDQFNYLKFLSHFFVHIFLPQSKLYLWNRDLRGGFNPFLKGFISGLKLHNWQIRKNNEYNTQKGIYSTTHEDIKQLKREFD